MKNHENVPAIIQPKTTRTTAVTTIMEGFFFSIQQAKSKLDKGRSLLKTLYLKIWALSIFAILQWSCMQISLYFLCFKGIRRQVLLQFIDRTKPFKFRGWGGRVLIQTLRDYDHKLSLKSWIPNFACNIGHWEPENCQFPMLEDLFSFSQPQSILSHVGKKPTGLMLGPLSTKS